MKIAIAYASLTGTTIEFAQEIHAYLTTKQLEAEEFDLLSTPADTFKGFDLVFLGGSTYGEGDLNPIAELFFTMTTPSTHDCDHTHIAIFALGDSSYTFFGKSGEIMEEKMAAMHAHVLQPTMIFDGGLDEENTQKLHAWVDEILAHMQ